MKQDIFQGRLPVPFELAAELGAYIVQCKQQQNNHVIILALHEIIALRIVYLIATLFTDRHSPIKYTAANYLENSTLILRTRLNI